MEMPFSKFHSRPTRAVRKEHSMSSTEAEATPAPRVNPRADRLVSLDVFRGATIAGMILVNNPGDWSHVYPALAHVAWNGWTPTDLIFPFFLFIMGTAIPFSYEKRIARGEGKGKLMRHVVTRALLLFAIGMFLTGIPDFNYSHKLILDVLQRIGVIYLISGTLYLITDVKWQVVVAVAGIVIYWILMLFVPVPGYGAGVLTPIGNMWWYVDRILLHGWHYHAEGILSLIPSVSTVFLGILTGHFLRTKRSGIEKAAVMLVAGNFGLVIGVIMAIWFPINKLLWSSSYVVFTAGFALEMLGVCFYLIDVKGYKSWTQPFLVFGSNAITSFFLSTFVALLLDLIGVSVLASGGVAVRESLKTYIFNAIFSPIASAYNASALYAIVYVIIWYGVMYVFYKRRIFIKI